MNRWLVFVGVFAGLILAGGVAAQAGPAAKDAGKNAPPTAAEAQKFIEDAEQRLFDLGVKASRAGWVQENFITDDTETMSAQANERTSK